MKNKKLPIWHSASAAGRSIRKRWLDADVFDNLILSVEGMNGSLRGKVRKKASNG